MPYSAKLRFENPCKAVTVSLIVSREQNKLMGRYSREDPELDAVVELAEQAYQMWKSGRNAQLAQPRNAPAGHGQKTERAGRP